MDKFRWDVAAVAAVGLAIVSWAASVEHRLDRAQAVENLDARVSQIETALLPVLVEYRVTQVMKGVAVKTEIVPVEPKRLQPASFPSIGKVGKKIPPKTAEMRGLL